MLELSLCLAQHLYHHSSGNRGSRPGSPNFCIGCGFVKPEGFMRIQTFSPSGTQPWKKRLHWLKMELGNSAAKTNTSAGLWIFPRHRVVQFRLYGRKTWLETWLKVAIFSSYHTSLAVAAPAAHQGPSKNEKKSQTQLSGSPIAIWTNINKYYQRKFRSSNFRLYWKLPVALPASMFWQQRCFGG